MPHKPPPLKPPPIAPPQMPYELSGRLEDRRVVGRNSRTGLPQYEGSSSPLEFLDMPLEGLYETAGAESDRWNSKSLPETLDASGRVMRGLWKMSVPFADPSRRLDMTRALARLAAMGSQSGLWKPTSEKPPVKPYDLEGYPAYAPIFDDYPDYAPIRKK